MLAAPPTPTSTIFDPTKIFSVQAFRLALLQSRRLYELMRVVWYFSLKMHLVVAGIRNG